MAEQLFVIGLGVGDDADAAWFLSGLALQDDTPEPAGSGTVTATLAVRDGVTASVAVRDGVTATIGGD